MAQVSALAIGGGSVALFEEDDFEDPPGLTVRLPEWLWDRLTEIASLETERISRLKGKRKVISRNEVIFQMLKQAAEAYADPSGPAGKKPAPKK